MSENFSLSNGDIVAEVDVESGGIYGTGGPEQPTIVVTLKFLFRCPTAQGLAMDFRELHCRVSPFDGMYMGDSRTTHLNVRIDGGKTVPNHQAFLQIPVDRVRLAMLNRLRNGKDVKLRLDIELFADELALIGKAGGPPNNAIWGLRAHHRMFRQMNIVVPRATWVERVLSATNFGSIHIIELPVVPIEKCAGLKASFDALMQAQKLESEGYYREAIAKCRIALEPFFEKGHKTDDKGEKKEVPVLKAAWQTRLGKATYEWLNASLVALKQPANQAAHLSSACFDQIETQMFLAVTTAVVAYAIKTQPPA
jgi:hypothetical protein